MNNVFLSGITTPPSGKKSLASQLGYCFVILFVILYVVSTTITSAYTAILEQDRADGLRSSSVVLALSMANTDLQEGVVPPIPAGQYKIGDDRISYIVNIYSKAGNSFLRVYSSVADKETDPEQVTLEGAGTEYENAYKLEEAVVVDRSDSDGSYMAGVAPIINSSGTVTGLAEVLMPSSSFYSTVNGNSLSWIFTMISIAVALAMVYYETNKLMTTMFGTPDRQLPKIIRYGLEGCQSMSFFSAMACTMPTLVMSSYIYSFAENNAFGSLPGSVFVLIGSVLFTVGFFGFASLKSYFMKRFTTRISLIISIFAAFVIMLISSLIPNIYVYIVLLFPLGFSLGMVIYFNREYRIYAGKLGYEEFSEQKIHLTQYIGYILGASVGAVMAGILYERFGLIAVMIISGCVLLVAGIQALLFVQHCPPSSDPTLHLPDFLYALSGKKSGAFVRSAVLTSGIQISFFFLFLPELLHSLRQSLATLSFYYILFAFVGGVVVRILMKSLPGLFTMQFRILSSSVLQVIGLFILALFPTAKMLVVSVIILGAAMGLHEFKYLEYYRQMIRPDKQNVAREILEKALTWGAVIGAAAFGVVFVFANIRIGLLILALLDAIVLLSYPLMTILMPQKPYEAGHNADNKNGAIRSSDNQDYDNQQRPQSSEPYPSQQTQQRPQAPLYSPDEYPDNRSEYGLNQPSFEPTYGWTPYGQGGQSGAAYGQTASGYPDYETYNPYRPAEDDTFGSIPFGQGDPYESQAFGQGEPYESQGYGQSDPYGSGNYGQGDPYGSPDYEQGEPGISTPYGTGQNYGAAGGRFTGSREGFPEYPPNDPHNNKWGN